MRAAALLLGVVFAACGDQPTPAPSAATISLLDVRGAAHCPLAADATHLSVLVFTSHECPIANAMAPTLGELAATFAGRPVYFFVVHVDPDLSPAAAARHAADYALPGTILLDPHHELARHLHIRRTPEAIVWQGQQVVYRGLIDDQWHDLGAHAQTASRHYLHDAILATLERRPVATPDTDPVGCLLPEPREH